MKIQSARYLVGALALFTNAVESRLTPRPQQEHEAQHPQRTVRSTIFLQILPHLLSFLTHPSHLKHLKYSILRSKGNKADKEVCGEDRVACQTTGKNKLFFCHHDKKKKLYETICIDESRVDRYLEKFNDDYCGECIENIVFRVFEFLDSKNSTSDAISEMNPHDMKKIVDKVKTLVSDDAMKDLITPESIIEAYYPHDAAVDLKHILKPEDIMSKYYPELYEEIVNGTNSSNRSRSLEGGSQVSAYPLPNDLSLLEFPDLFPDLPPGCWSAIFSWFASLVGVVLALTPLKLFKNAIGNVVARAYLKRLPSAETAIEEMFRLYDEAVTSGKKLKIIWAWIGAISKVTTLFGLKVFFQAILDEVMNSKPDLTTYTFLVGSMLFQLIAWVSTGWTAFIFNALNGLLSVDFFVDASKELRTSCKFGQDSDCGKMIDCDDDKMCTKDTAKCESGKWHCVNTQVFCQGGFSCDPKDGNCKKDDELIPCVAVIDEDDGFGTPNQAAMWTDFKNRYPSRPFCLLVPNPEGKVGVPPNFLNDGLTTVKYNIVRDNGDQAKAEDWALKCGLDLFTSNQVGYVGLFVDDSGSMKKSQVIASYDKFILYMTTKRIEVKYVVNEDENWILPFLTTLVPNEPIACVAKDGREGECIDTSDCTANGKIPVPWQQGDPAPNCFNFPSNIQCCVDAKACVTKDGKEGECIDSGVCTTSGKIPVPWQQGDPQPNCSDSPSNIQCCVVTKACVTKDGRKGGCIDSGVCTTSGNTPVPWQQGDPQPNCSDSPSNIQCCVDAKVCVTRGGRQGECIDSGVCTTSGKTPVPWQQGDPAPNCSDSPSNIQCCVKKIFV